MGLCVLLEAVRAVGWHLRCLDTHTLSPSRSEHAVICATKAALVVLNWGLDYLNMGSLSARGMHAGKSSSFP